MPAQCTEATEETYTIANFKYYDSQHTIFRLFVSLFLQVPGDPRTLRDPMTRMCAVGHACSARQSLHRHEGPPTHTMPTLAYRIVPHLGLKRPRAHGGRRYACRCSALTRHASSGSLSNAGSARLKCRNSAAPSATSSALVA